MPSELIDTIDNARYVLELALPAYQQGTLVGVEQLHGIATMHRSRGVAQLLLRGVPDPLFIGQMQSASAFAFGLPQLPEDDKATAHAAPWWDAIGATYWDAAHQIAAASRMTHNPKREHEDDFLCVAFLMHRYFLSPGPDATAQERAAHDDAQLQRLTRWEQVLEGGIDPRLSLCHALLEHDAEDFAEAILATADARAEDLSQRGRKGRLSDEELAWLRPIWPQGLALLRLAERDGLSTEGLVVPGVPPVIQVDNPYTYHPDAWRTIDFQPQRSAWRR
ncbi:MAG: Imm49 family immunity protein [Nannocystaceae bacterium]